MARSPSAESLQALVDIARTGSIAAAARALGLTQQAVSGRIASLERAVGLRVLERTTTGSRLTDAGALLAGWAADVLEATQRLDAGVRTLVEDRPARIRVAASQTIAESLLPRWIVQLRGAEADRGASAPIVELVVDNSTGVIDRIRTESVDLGFIETPALPDGLKQQTIGHDELVLVVAPHHRWAGRDDAVTLTELAAEPLVVREPGSGTREAFDQVLAAAGLMAVAPAAELSTTAAIRSAVAAGIAPGVLSRLVVRDDLVLGRLVALPTEGAPLQRPLTALRPRGTTPAAVDDLIAIASGQPLRART